VGHEVRRWRSERGLTLAQVAQLSGLNLGYLSQIENDKATPSLDALGAIAAALDIPIAWLFLDGTPSPRVVRANERPMAKLLGGTAAEVDGGSARDVRILEATIQPGARTGLHAHSGDEHHLVLSGRWRMTQGDHTIELEPGDYLAWDANVPHDVENIGEEVGRLLIVYARRPAAAPRNDRSGSRARGGRRAPIRSL
jgi:mannose-6-phosphate isomerase-like protein (cupin superfamily)